MFIKKFDYERVPELQRMCMDWALCKRLREKEIFDRCEVPTKDPPEHKTRLVQTQKLDLDQVQGLRKVVVFMNNW